jgi:hypothetical protein
MNWTDSELCRIALKHHTDKAHFHNYTPTYHKLLAGKSVKKVLEIGLGWGGLMHNDYQSAGSLLMWRDYFPDAEIYGLDIRPDALRNENRIHSFLCDQNDIDSLMRAAAQVGDDFDLIVDDGSHVPMHQVTTASIFVPLLAPGGLYVIEDVHDAYFQPGPEHVHVPTGDLTELEYVRQNLPYPHEVIEIENDIVPGDKLVVIREEQVARGTKRSSRCVVNVAIGDAYYKRGQMRLAQELRRFDPWSKQMMWQCIPPGWPDQKQKPYAFKSFAMKEAAKIADLVLWCDSSIVPIRPMDAFWEILQSDGYFLVENGEGMNYEWTADSAYQYLFPELSVESARSASRAIPQIVGGILGVNIKSEKGNAFLEEYYRLAKDTDAFCGPWANQNCPTRAQYGKGSVYTTAPCGPPDVRGHRHDQTAASVIAWNMGLKLSKYPSPYAYIGPSSKTAPTRETILLHDGPGATEFEAQLSKPEEPTMKCAQCGSAALGMAGGMLHCNQCGYRSGH